MEQEDLVRDFITVSGLKIGCIRTDNKFMASTVFKAFCKGSMITYAPSAAYMHTSASGRGCANLQGSCPLSSQVKQCASSFLAFHLATFWWHIQLLARSKLTSAMGVHGQLAVQLQPGARPPSLGLLRCGEAAKRTSPRQCQHNTC
eukprot:2887119-Rhodomonas_salina.1